MTSKRKFYKTVIRFEVLSEEPVEQVDLETLHYEVTEGRWSGRFLDTTEEILDGPQMAKALQEQSSDPEFFNLDSDGNDVEED